MTSNTTANPMEQVYDLLSGLYSSTQLPGQNTFLAFEGLGMAITPEMFMLAPDSAAPSPTPAPDSAPTKPALLPELGVERLSAIANTVFEVTDSTIQHSTRTVDKMVEFLLLQSTPDNAADTASLGALKDPAEKDFEPTLGSLEGMFRYHPVYANPVNWYDPDSSDNWTAHTIKQQDDPPTQVTNPTPSPTSTSGSGPARVVNIPPLNWRVLPIPLRPAPMQSIGIAHPGIAAINAQSTSNATVNVNAVSAQPSGTLPTTHPPSPSIMLRRETSLVRPGIAATSIAVPATQAPTAALEQTLAEPEARQMSTMHFDVAAATARFRPLLLAQTTAQLNASATPQPVATRSMEISFEHCIVTLARPWFPEMFFMARDWYIPGYPRGAFSNGTGVGDTGLLPVLPSGFVMIRNLTISAQWSNQDIAAVTEAVSLGPLSLMGSSFDAGSNTLSCPGMQIIGWFCDALPVLPPMSDPALATPSTNTTSLAQGTADSNSTQPGSAGTGSAVAATSNPSSQESSGAKTAVSA